MVRASPVASLAQRSRHHDRCANCGNGTVKPERVTCKKCGRSRWLNHDEQTARTAGMSEGSPAADPYRNFLDPARRSVTSASNSSGL